jgi:hypothetical protein
VNELAGLVTTAWAKARGGLGRRRSPAPVCPLRRQAAGLLQSMTGPVIDSGMVPPNLVISTCSEIEAVGMPSFQTRSIRRCLARREAAGFDFDETLQALSPISAISEEELTLFPADATLVFGAPLPGGGVCRPVDCVSGTSIVLPAGRGTEEPPLSGIAVPLPCFGEDPPTSRLSVGEGGFATPSLC